MVEVANIVKHIVGFIGRDVLEVESIDKLVDLRLDVHQIFEI